MGLPVGADPLAGAVGSEPERVPLGQVVGSERHVAGVGARRRSRPPQQVPADAALVRDERHAEIGSQLAQLGRRLDPPLGRDEVVALRQRRQVRGVVVDRDGRAILGRRGHSAMLAPA